MLAHKHFLNDCKTTLYKFSS